MAANSYGWAQPASRPASSSQTKTYTQADLMSRNLDPAREAWVKQQGGMEKAFAAAGANQSQGGGNFGQVAQGQGSSYSMGQGPTPPRQGQQMNMPPQNWGSGPAGGAGGSYPGMPPGSAIGNIGPNQGSTRMPQQGGNQAQQILDQWRGAPGSADGTKDWTNPQWYANEGNRNTMEGYSSLYAVPMFNAAMAARTQDYNELSGDRNFGEQQYLNRGQMDLAYRGSGREDLALKYGQENNVRDFGETQRQFNQGFGLQQELGRGNLAATNFANDTQRQLGQQQNAIADYEAKTGRIDVEGRQKLDAFRNDTERQNVNNQFSLGNAANANNRYATDVEKLLGQGALSNQAFANQAQAQRYQGQTTNEAFANQTALQNVQNQFSLGQGQLGFQGRELDVNEAFRRSQLAQDADLTREKFKNDLMNTRMATQGRAAGPNQRAVRSWY